VNWPGPEGSLRELVKRGTLAILEELEVIRDEMEQRKTKEDRTTLTYQIASLSEGLRELEVRVTRL